MGGLQEQAAELIRADPDVVGVVSFVGAGEINATPNAGRLTIVLKPRPDRIATARQVADRLQARLTAVTGLSVFLQPVQDIQIGTRISSTRFQYTLVDTDPAELATCAPLLVEQ